MDWTLTRPPVLRELASVDTLDADASGTVRSAVQGNAVTLDAEGHIHKVLNTVAIRIRGISM